ncbi:putative linker histone H1/H5, domain H15, winged helix-like DNA-binding domain superfamily [Helianthus annuus]|nr:putative linker histone H1/H5, domain H15, winged helix-like DNA-binding domain superfamily [Helianthus annuus]
MATEEPIVPTEVTEPVVAPADVTPEEKPEVKAEEKPKKVKKAAKGKPRSPSLHPPYFEMIKEAIVTLKERTGSSQYAITKFIEEKQKNLPANFKKVLFTQLKKFVAAGKLVKVKASYKLPASTVPAKKPAAKAKTVAKPKTAKKKAPAKKAPVKKTVKSLKPKAAIAKKAAVKTGKK